MVNADKLMCHAHWREVPAELQREVYAAWRDRTNDVPGGMRRHLIAMERAEAAVEGREPELDGLLGGDDE
jgi:hypothetical protein